jgi:hypothetical protein
MMDFITRQARSAVTGVLTPVELTSKRLISTLIVTAALGIVAAAAAIGMLILLSLALDRWVADQFGSAIGALVTAGFYLVVLLFCVLLLWARGAKREKIERQEQEAEAIAKTQQSASHLSANLEQTIAPIVDILHQSGMKREEIAVRLATQATKQMGPVTLVGLALAVGFLSERALESRRKAK